MNITSLAEIGMDQDSGTFATFAMEKAYFEEYDTSLSHGCWDVNGQHAAHHMVDYVKIWDLPSDMKVTNFSY